MEKEKQMEFNNFYERPFEEVDDGYIDDRGFYTTSNGSFWDEEHNYFNNLGFDKYGGSYDKYGVYHPGEDYDEKLGMYNDQKDLFSHIDNIDENEINNDFISKLKEQGEEDLKNIEKYGLPKEESEEDDDNNDFCENDLKEAYEEVMKKEDPQKHNDINKSNNYIKNSNSNNNEIKKEVKGKSFEFKVGSRPIRLFGNFLARLGSKHVGLLIGEDFFEFGANANSNKDKTYERYNFSSRKTEFNWDWNEYGDKLTGITSVSPDELESEIKNSREWIPGTFDDITHNCHDFVDFMFKKNWMQ